MSDWQIFKEGLTHRYFHVCAAVITTLFFFIGGMRPFALIMYPLSLVCLSGEWVRKSWRDKWDRTMQEEHDKTLVDRFSDDIAIFLRVHTDDEGWTADMEPIRTLSQHLVHVTKLNRT